MILCNESFSLPVNLYRISHQYLFYRTGKNLCVRSRRYLNNLHRNIHSPSSTFVLCPFRPHHLRYHFRESTDKIRTIQNIFSDIRIVRHSNIKCILDHIQQIPQFTTFFFAASIRHSSGYRDFKVKFVLFANIPPLIEKFIGQRDNIVFSSFHSRLNHLVTVLLFTW